MKRVANLLLASMFAAAFSVAPPVPASGGGAFFSEVSPISDRLAQRMRGKSWHRGCPVPIRNLRLMKVSYHGFDGERHIGKLVVHKGVATEVVGVLRSMWRDGFKIRKMYLVDRYEGSDHKSMRADNTSAFNCRTVAGTDNWSQHAYGRAIDVNPVENPYVSADGSVSPKRGSEYADRSLRRKGMIHADDATVRAFEDAGWGWGGYWSSAKDYQHFSATGT